MEKTGDADGTVLRRYGKGRFRYDGVEPGVETLAEIVEHGRKKYGDFAPELFILDGSTDFMFDLKVWLDDYMEFLEQEEEQEQLEKVCRKL